MRVALETVLDRIPDYSLDPDGTVAWMSGGVSVGVTSLPVRFTPGPSLSHANQPLS
jgi:hypothetical protein